MIYATPADGVARITLNRPDKRNAQNAPLLYALDAAFQKAARDNDIRCIILDAAGADFSAGHDLSAGYLKNIEYIKGINPVTMEGGFDRDGAEGMYATEQEIYLDLVKRIRNLPKPTIAAVQGKCIAAGLMLAWACDLIIASEEATFMDPVVTYGMPGVEWFAHPYELGIRKAKQMLFTADKWTAADAKVFGMVNEVVARDALADTALAMASKIATKPTFALRTVKEAINRAADHPGIQPSIEANMPLHHLAHQHNMRLYGRAMDPTHVPGWSAAPAKKPAE
ncbi:hypothetical protein ATO6_19785 [Oceanicola sp. 22II-s10i]|nr:hypothetical protein ATO6_19785 [Oceanicola sp. 22II-s10i]